MDSNKLLPEAKTEDLIVPEVEHQPVVYRPPYFGRPNFEEPQEDDTRQILEYLQILLKRKWFILSLAFVGFVLSIAISLVMTPIYRAHTSLEIEAGHDKALSDQELSTNEALGDIETQVELLQSQVLIERTLDNMDPDKPLAQPKQGLKDQLSSDAKTSTGGNEPPKTQPRPKRPKPSAWKRLLAQFRFPKKLSPEEEAIQTAVGSLEIKQQKDSRILDIYSDSTDPDVAVRFVNTLVSEYMQQRIEDRWKAYQQTGEWLSQAHQELKGKLEKSEEKLQAYARASGLVFTSETQSVAEEKLKQLQDELSRAQGERITKESQYKIVLSSPADSLPDSLVSALFKEYQGRLTELHRQYAELSSTLTPAHYKVKKIQAQINEVEAALAKERANIVQRFKNDYQAALSREKMLSNNYAAQTSVVTDQSEKAIQFKVLKQEVDTNRKIYEDTLQKGKEASLESALQASNVRVVDPATPPFFPYKPRILLNAGLGLFGGLFLGSAFVLLRHLVNRSIKAPGASPYVLNVPELGVIPSSSADPQVGMGGLFSRFMPAVEAIRGLGSRTGFRGRLTAGGPSRAGMELVSWRHKPSLIAEHFRNVMVSILAFGQKQGSPRAIVVTSASPGEGKTTVICNLGISLAEIGKRVVLIDADLRKPRLHRIFDRANTWGLSNVLRENVPVENYPLETLVRKTDIPGLFLLSSGPGSSNMSNMFSSRVPQLLDRLKREFDIVLIDTPPALQMADSRVVSQNVDAVILVIRARRTQQEAALAAIQRFQEDGVLILGTILNDWNPKTATAHSYHYDYSYHYSGDHRS
jgi:succinoglycan biosynthesis transport protein ExoP